MTAIPHAREEQQAQLLRERLARYLRVEDLLGAFPHAKQAYRLDAAFDADAQEITVRAEIVLRFPRTLGPAPTDAEGDAQAVADGMNEVDRLFEAIGQQRSSAKDAEPARAA